MRQERVHVDPENGDDQNPDPGTWLRPFRTFRRAQAYVERHGAFPEGLTVLLLSDQARDSDDDPSRFLRLAPGSGTLTISGVPEGGKVPTLFWSGTVE